jgi:hypothetical protein
MKNFGKIKESLNNILAESIIKTNDEGKDIFKKYMKMLKENEILKSQYIIYDNLEKQNFSDSSEALEYVKESIDVLKSYSKEDILKSNNELTKLIVKESKFGGDYRYEELHNNISFLIFTDKKATNIDKINESRSFIKNHLLTDKKEGVVTESVNLPPSVLTKLSLEKFNRKYENISESEKKIIKSLLNGDNETKEKVFNELVRECIDVIDNKLQESEIDVKEKLLNAKDKLLRMEYDSENYRTDINKVYNLKESIS